MFAWIRRIGKNGAPPAREILLNQGLSLAMQWGDDWLKPIQGRLARRFPVLSRDQLDEINFTCQAVMKFGHAAVYDLAEKFGKDTKREEFVRVMSVAYPWINEENLSQLFSQGMYYAWKDLGFA